MKKYWISIALGTALMFTAPAWAIQADFSGEYRTEGICNDHLSLKDDDDTSADAYMGMRLQLKSVFTISDKISLTTRITGLDKRWGDDDNAKATSDSESYSGTPSADSPYPMVRTTTSVEDDDNIDLDWAYVTIKTGLGGFLVGRQKGNTWGLSFSDTEDPRDRVIYVLPIQNTIIAAVYEKTKEFDGNDESVNDADMDKYYFTVTQKGEKFNAGFLYGFYNYKTFQDLWQNRQTAYSKHFLDALGNLYTFSDAGHLSSEAGAHVISPYFNGKFGPLAVRTEFDYAYADFNYDAPYHVTPTDAQFAPVYGTGDETLIAGYLATGVENPEGEDTKKGNAYAYNVEATFDVAGFTFMAGYAFCSGDSDPNDDKLEAFGYIAPGEDWEKLAILNGTSYGLDKTLGGLGNLAGGGKATWDGYKMFYLGADYAVTDTMTFGLLYGKSEADKATRRDSSRSTVYAAVETLSGTDFANNDWDKNHGQEYDLTFKWKIFPNLKYNAIAAYLDAGDYWKKGNDNTDLQDTFLLFHRLTVEF